LRDRSLFEAIADAAVSSATRERPRLKLRSTPCFMDELNGSAIARASARSPCVSAEL